LKNEEQFLDREKIQLVFKSKKNAKRLKRNKITVAFKLRINRYGCTSLSWNGWGWSKWINRRACAGFCWMGRTCIFVAEVWGCLAEVNVGDDFHELVSFFL
jgi:hypothetical protein